MCGWLRGTDSNRRPSGYEPDELPLLHPATQNGMDRPSIGQIVRRPALARQGLLRLTRTEVRPPSVTNGMVARTHRPAHRAGHVRTPPHRPRPRARCRRRRLPRSTRDAIGDVAQRASRRCPDAPSPPWRVAVDRAPRATGPWPDGKLGDQTAGRRFLSRPPALPASLRRSTPPVSPSRPHVLEASARRRRRRSPTALPSRPRTGRTAAGC
jgi:hypothetical protein